MAPSTLSIISNMFRDEREKTFAVSVWVASFSFGGATGPIAGGVLITRFWWGAVFLAPIPIMVLLLILGPKLLPEHRSASAGQIDLLSAALTLASVLPIIFGIKQMAEGGNSWLAKLAIFVGAACRNCVRPATVAIGRSAPRPTPVRAAGPQRRARDQRTRFPTTYWLSAVALAACWLVGQPRE